MSAPVLLYWPNPAHKRETSEAGPPASRPDKSPCPRLAVEERSALLESSVIEDPERADSPRFAVRRGTDGPEFFEARLTRFVGSVPEYHGFPTDHVPARVLRVFRERGLLLQPEYRRLVRELG